LKGKRRNERGSLVLCRACATWKRSRTKFAVPRPESGHCSCAIGRWRNSIIQHAEQ